MCFDKEIYISCSVNVDLSKVLNRALATGVNHNQSGNQTDGSVIFS